MHAKILSVVALAAVVCGAADGGFGAAAYHGLQALPGAGIYLD